MRKKTVIACFITIFCGIDFNKYFFTCAYKYSKYWVKAIQSNNLRYEIPKQEYQKAGMKED
jgi:hypothetical protein